MRAMLKTVAVALAAASLLSACAKGGAGAGLSDDDMTLGKADAPVTVIEYASDTCSHCARFDKDVFPAFKAKYIDTGKVHYVFREFLTAPENVAASGFLLARCAGKDKYFQVVEAIFRSQEEMFATGDFRTPLLRIAKSVGMTDAQFNACVSDEKALAALQTRVDKAINEAKVSGTPTFFVNGKQIAEGEVTMTQFDNAIQPLLAGKK
jgi:protein-disulfide isomerase